MSNKEKKNKSNDKITKYFILGDYPRLSWNSRSLAFPSTRRFMKKGASLISLALCKPILIPNDHLFPIWMLTYFLFSVHSKFCWEPMANPMVHHNPKMIPFLKLWAKITHHPVSLPFSSSPKKNIDCKLYLHFFIALKYHSLGPRTMNLLWYLHVLLWRCLHTHLSSQQNVKLLK